jgi:hypothetical protein
MLYCKSGNWYELNPQRGRSNNSVVLLRHKIDEKEFKKLWDKIKTIGTGEPGIFFTNNKEMGCNPCGEISLKNQGFCNLCEINMDNIEDQFDLEERAKAAAFIGTLQASYTDFYYLRDSWQRNSEKDALLGVSGTGIASGSVNGLDLRKAVEALLEENTRISNKIGIKPAARATCVKPAGCCSLNTKIRTDKGILSMEEIFFSNGIKKEDIEKAKNGTWIDPLVELSVFDDNNKYQKIKKLYINGLVEVFEVYFEDGTIGSFTGNHKLKTTKGWKRIDELSEDDDIICL